VEEQCAASARPGLGQLLCGDDSEREAGVDDLGRQPVDRVDTAIDDLVEADLLDESLPRFDALEGAALEQVGRVHVVEQH
jgi:hypothetical protein